MILNTVDGQGDHLDASLLELIADSGGAGELSGADRREVPRVGKQDAPSAEENAHQAQGPGSFLQLALHLGSGLRSGYVTYSQAKVQAAMT